MLYGNSKAIAFSKRIPMKHLDIYLNDLQNVISIYFAQRPTRFNVYAENLFSTFRARIDLCVCVLLIFNKG